MNGMFAIALWDRTERTLHLIRDRLGIKPLVSRRNAQGSLVRLRAEGAGGCRPQAGDRSGARSRAFLRFGYVPTPYSIFRGVTKVKPGEIVSIDARPANRASPVLVGRRALRRPGCRNRLPARDGAGRIRTERSADRRGRRPDDRRRAARRVSVRRHRFLDRGGADGGGQSAGRCGHSRSAFDVAGYDESQARRRGRRASRHRPHRIDGDGRGRARRSMPQLAEMYDEPFADSSQIPTYLMSKLTRGMSRWRCPAMAATNCSPAIIAMRWAMGWAGSPRARRALLRRALAALINAMPPKPPDQCRRAAAAVTASAVQIRRQAAQARRRSAARPRGVLSAGWSASGPIRRR